MLMCLCVYVVEREREELITCVQIQLMNMDDKQASDDVGVVAVTVSYKQAHTLQHGVIKEYVCYIYIWVREGERV